MNLTKILTVVFYIISIALAGFLVYRIKSEIDHKAQIAEVEQRVKDRLMMIRTAQQAYQRVNDQFTSDWDKLISFIDTGKIYIIDKKEEIITLDYGADSVVIHYDTVRFVQVKDSLLALYNVPDFNIDELPLIPESKGKKFEMFADKISRGNVEVDVVEVKDIAPYDRTRKEDSEARNRKPLRFGSRTDVTVAGNWE